MRYFELRRITSPTDATIAADIVKHLQTRQYLGRAIVLCDRPAILMGITHKYWYKLARSLQRERASTVDSEKILRLTKSITHMHRMRFVAKRPDMQPDSHVYFVTGEELAMSFLPVNSYSFYLTTPIASPRLSAVLEELPHDALIADYTGTLHSNELPFLAPKTMAEAEAISQWHSLEHYLAAHGIHIQALTNRSTAEGFQAVDDALDTLLGIGHSFLQLASAFQHSFEFAQPFHFVGTQQRQYEVFLLLAHRVQALSPMYPLADNLLPDNLQNETFFLHDGDGGQLALAEILLAAITYHRQAGRHRLARALAFAYS